MAKSNPNLMLEAENIVDNPEYNDRVKKLSDLSEDSKKKIYDSQISNSKMFTSFKIVASDSLFLQAMLNEVLKHQTPIVPFYKGDSPAFFVGDPDVIKHILVTHQENYIKNISPDIVSVIGESLFAIGSWEPYRAHKREIGAVFHMNLLKFMMQSFSGSIEDLADRWSKFPGNVAIDFQQEILRLGVELRIRAFYSKKNGLLPPKERDMAKAFWILFNEGQKRFRMPFIRNIPSSLRWTNARFTKWNNRLQNFVQKLVAERLNEPDPMAHDDFLKYFLQFTKEPQKLIDETKEFISALAPQSLIIWTFICLSMYPEVEQRLVAEIRLMLGDASDNKPINYEDLQKCHYLTRVVNEVMRLYPPAPAFARESVKDDVITVANKEYAIPKGSFVLISPYLIHRNPKFWDNPLTFNPDRFLPDNMQKFKHEYAYFPFGAGERSCLGRNIALTETKLTLALLLRKFHVEIHKPTNIVETPIIFLYSQNPIDAIIVPRNEYEAKISGPFSCERAKSLDDIERETAAEEAEKAQKKRALLEKQYKKQNVRNSISVDNAENYLSNPNERSIIVLYGTEWGFAKSVAIKVVQEINKIQGYRARIMDLKYYYLVDFTKTPVMLFVCSTAGDGWPPIDTRLFFDFFLFGKNRKLNNIQYSVCALGSRSYPTFCKAGKRLDERLLELGAKRFLGRAEIDNEDWTTINEWIEAVIENISNLEYPQINKARIIEVRKDSRLIRLSTQTGNHVEELQPQDITYDRMHPYIAKLLKREVLTKNLEEGYKETFHFEFDISNSGISYTPGDWVGIIPQNDPNEVDKVLSLMQWKGDEIIDMPEWFYYRIGRHSKSEEFRYTIREALTTFYDIRNVKESFLKLMKQHLGDNAAMFGTLFSKIENEFKSNFENPRRPTKTRNWVHLKPESIVKYLDTRHLIDILSEFPSRPPMNEFIANLRPLIPRMYSVSCSPNPNFFSITVGIETSKVQGNVRIGVCGNYLKNLKIEDTVPIFFHTNENFRLPSIPETPIILIGAGTGIAPIRSFIQERIKNPEPSNILNTLFFGCRHSDKDFLYKEEIEKLKIDDALTYFAAFSRENPGQQIYVQNKVEENSRLIWDLLLVGANIYICGSKKMFEGVEKAIRSLVCKHGHYDEQSVETFMQNLQENRKLQRDVW